jgi:hypothetical protein
LITGKSGTGKSEYFIRYIEAVAGRYRHVFIFDFEAEFAARAGWPNVRTIEQLNNPGHIVAYDPCEMYPGDRPTAFEFFCDYVFSIAEHYDGQDGSILFCSDELQKIGMGTDVIPQDLTVLVETGRRYKVDTVFIAQQCNLIHNRLRNQVTEVVTFRHNEDRAIRWLVEYGFDEQAIRDLDPVGAFICRNDRGIEVTGNIFPGGKRPEQPEEKPLDNDEGNPEGANIEDKEKSSPDLEAQADDSESDGVE